MWHRHRFMGIGIIVLAALVFGACHGPPAASVVAALIVAAIVGVAAMAVADDSGQTATIAEGEVQPCLSLDPTDDDNYVPLVAPGDEDDSDDQGDDDEDSDDADEDDGDEKATDDDDNDDDNGDEEDNGDDEDDTNEEDDDEDDSSSEVSPYDFDTMDVCLSLIPPDSPSDSSLIAPPPEPDSFFDSADEENTEDDDGNSSIPREKRRDILDRMSDRLPEDIVARLTQDRD